MKNNEHSLINRLLKVKCLELEHKKGKWKTVI